MAGQCRESGEAGRRGPTSGPTAGCRLNSRIRAGSSLNLNSKVEALFGDSIREGVLETLSRPSDVENARVTVEDQGALPWVIQARLETALLRAGAELPGMPGRPARPTPRPEGTPRDRLRRSRLYLPGNEPKFAVNAGLHRPGRGDPGPGGLGPSRREGCGPAHGPKRPPLRGLRGSGANGPDQPG